MLCIHNCPSLIHNCTYTEGNYVNCEQKTVFVLSFSRENILGGSPTKCGSVTALLAHIAIVTGKSLSNNV